MRNITLSADETVIAKARSKASLEQTTLNQLFREWLAEYTEPSKATRDQIQAVLDKYSNFRVGVMPTRDERNAR